MDEVTYESDVPFLDIFKANGCAIYPEGVGEGVKKVWVRGAESFFSFTVGGLDDDLVVREGVSSAMVGLGLRSFFRFDLGSLGLMRWPLRKGHSLKGAPLFVVSGSCGATFLSACGWAG